MKETFLEINYHNWKIRVSYQHFQLVPLIFGKIGPVRGNLELVRHPNADIDKTGRWDRDIYEGVPT